MRWIIAIASVAVVVTTLSACTIYQAPPGGQVTVVPGYNYEPKSSDEPDTFPNGATGGVNIW